MKIDLVYPKIPNTKGCELKTCYAFAKEDGTNIHACWTPNKGYTSFGTRRDRFEFSQTGNLEFQEEHPGLEDVYKALKFSPNFMVLDEVLMNNYKDANEVILFAEYLGDNSFAGAHRKNDEKRLVLFDVMVDGEILHPDIFLNKFSRFGITKLIYHGKYSGQFVEDVRNGKYKVKEGVVIKGIVKNKLYMAKIKTNNYMQRLQNEFEDKWKDYWE